MGFMSSTSKRLATKAKNLTKKALSSRHSSDSAPQNSDGTSSRAAPQSFDFQPELYGDPDPQQEQQDLITLKPLSGAGKRPSRGSASLVCVWVVVLGVGGAVWGYCCGGVVLSHTNINPHSK